MKNFKTYLNEGVVKWLKMPHNRSTLLIDGKMVGTIEFYPGAPDILPGDNDKWSVTLGGTYRDSRLKINRTVFRTIGTFDTEEQAKQALMKAAKAASK